jgi:hypothetical protein
VCIREFVGDEVFRGVLGAAFALDSIGEGHNRGVGRSDGKFVSGGSMEGRKERRKGRAARTTPYAIVRSSDIRISAIVSRLPAKPLKVTDSGVKLRVSSWRCRSRQDSDLCKIQLCDDA